MSKRTEGLWRKLMAGTPPVDESATITSAEINQQTADRMAPERRFFIPGIRRIFGNHSVCTTCGAMVDNEFLVTHHLSHNGATQGE